MEFQRSAARTAVAAASPHNLELAAPREVRE